SSDTARKRSQAGERRSTSKRLERKAIMRLTVLTTTGALLLSAGLYAQSAPPALPKCLQDAPPVNLEAKDVSVAKVLPFLGAACGIEIRVESVDETQAVRAVQSLRFQQAKVADIFRMLLQASGLTYRVIDERSIVVTKQ